MKLIYLGKFPHRSSIKMLTYLKELIKLKTNLEIYLNTNPYSTDKMLNI